MSFITVEGMNVGEGFGPFNKTSRIALVIDHPTLDDIKARQPLQGTYGSILAQCLGLAGLTQSECSIYYVLPNPSIAGMWTPKTGFTSAGQDCVFRLINELRQDDPTIIVPLGEIPLLALTGKHGITKWRNSILRCNNLETKVIPTICPKVASREYLYRYHIANDLKRIKEESMFRTITYTERDLKIQPNFIEAKAYLENIRDNVSIFAFDIEVHKLEVSCIAFAISPYDCMSIPFDTRWSMEEEMILWRLIDNILGDASKEKILQNATFDISFLLAKNNIITRGYIHDTMIKHNLNYPDFPKNLGFICSLYTREPFYKDEGKDSFKGPIRDYDQYYRYNAKDAAITFEANDRIQDELVKFGNAETYEFNQRLIHVLFYMMHRGIRINNESLVKHRTQATKEQAELQAELNNLAGFDFNVSSPAQCKKYFYEVKGYKALTSIKKDPKTGERKSTVTTDNKAMKKLALRGCKEATLVQKIRGYRKLIGTYLNIDFDKDGRLRCSLNISGTTSGRLSSSSTIFGTGTNMQNLPKVFKEFLIADPGQIFIEMDKAQAEWVVVAYCCGDANMIRTVESREDAHINTAHLMFGAPKELMILEDKLVGSLSDEAKILAIRQEHCPELLAYHPISNMSCRQAGKKSNHGLNYDLGANGFAATYGLSLQEANRCCDLYHRAYPSIRIWHASIRNQLGRDRTLENLFGRKRRFLNRWCDDLFKQAYAFIPQSTVAQLLNYGLIKLYEKQHEEDLSYLRPLDILLQVHDSMVAQYPIAETYDMARTLLTAKKFFETPLTANGRTFTIRTDAKLGYDAKNLFGVSIDGSVEQVEQNILATLQTIEAYRKDHEPTIELMEDDEDESETEV